MTPRLSIIIVNYNGREHLENCLSSLAQHPPATPHEIVVVDNASTDGSVEAVAEGDDQALQRLVEWARHGPAGAQVDTVEVNPANAAQTIDLNVPFAQRSSV